MKKRFLFPLVAAIALPTVANAEVNNDYILKARQSYKLISEGKFSEAEKICDELIEISPDNPNGYVCKGISLGFTGKNKRKSREAIRNFTKAIEINPENYQIYYLRGILQFSMRRTEFSKLQMNGCSDIKKAYLNNNPGALEYVKRKRSFLIRNKCSGFF